MIKNCVFFKRNYALQKVDIDDIVVLVAKKNHVWFFLEGAEHVVRITLQYALSRLPEGQFVQIHRGIAVSVSHIEKIKELTVYLKNFEDTLPMSRQYYRKISKQIFIMESKSVGKKDSDLNMKESDSLISLKKLTSKHKKKGQR